MFSSLENGHFRGFSNLNCFITEKINFRENLLRNFFVQNDEYLKINLFSEKKFILSGVSYKGDYAKNLHLNIFLAETFTLSNPFRICLTNNIFYFFVFFSSGESNARYEHQ